MLGPATWEKLPGMKIGKRQSPIDIVQANASFDKSLKSLKFSYPSFENANLKNNGRTLLFSPNEQGNTSGRS
jgi:carbonic anhydrase